MVRCSSLFKLLFCNPNLDPLQQNAYLYLEVYQGFEIITGNSQSLFAIIQAPLPVIQQLWFFCPRFPTGISLQCQKLSIIFSSKLCCLLALSFCTFSLLLLFFTTLTHHFFPEHSFLSLCLSCHSTGQRLGGGEPHWQNSPQLAEIIYPDSCL